MYDKLDFDKTEYLDRRKAILRRIKVQEEAADRLMEKLGGNGGVSVYETKFGASFNPDKIAHIAMELAIRRKIIDNAKARFDQMDRDFARAALHFSLKEQLILYTLYHYEKPVTTAETTAGVQHGYVAKEKLLERFKSLFL